MKRRKNLSKPELYLLGCWVAFLLFSSPLFTGDVVAQTPAPSAIEPTVTPVQSAPSEVAAPNPTPLAEISQEATPIAQPSPEVVATQPPVTPPFAQSTPSPAPVAKSAAGADTEYETYLDFGTVLWKTMRALLVVLALIALSVWAFKKFFRKTTLAGEHALTRVIGRVYLNPKTVVYLVKVLDRVLVVGTNPNTIRLLTEIREPESVARLDRAPAPAPESSRAVQSFAAQLTKLQETPPASAPSTGELSRIDHHLEEIRKQIAKLESFSKELEGEE